jgi:peptidoglycan hydrolase CwlO-like protein
VRQTQRLVRLKARQQRMIERYLKLQDQADRTNGRIYDLCCRIEQANQEIAREEERIRNGEAAPA